MAADAETPTGYIFLRDRDGSLGRRATYADGTRGAPQVLNGRAWELWAMPEAREIDEATASAMLPEGVDLHAPANFDSPGSDAVSDEDDYVATGLERWSRGE